VLVKENTTHLINPAAYTARLTLKINEAAALIGVSHQTIRRAITRGDIRVSRKTRHLLIPRAELERFIAA
jgi:excisionase family DNA binding protein